MTDLNISPALLSTPAATARPSKIKDAAEQFESLLIGQILRSAREGGGGWLGEEDSSSDCATEFAEQQLATVIAKQGGFGLGAIIGKGLESESKAASRASPGL
jgi:peptidoglycan hydrolase FlgJ